MNHGILANQLGHGDEAVQSWKQAIALDGSQVAAYLYTAGELDREGKPEAAIPYYMMFLNKVAQAGAEQPPARTGLDRDRHAAGAVPDSGESSGAGGKEL